MCHYLLRKKSPVILPQSPILYLVLVNFFMNNLAKQVDGILSDMWMTWNLAGWYLATELDSPKILAQVE